MAKETPLVTVTLDGDEVELRCTPNAIVQLCRIHGDMRSLQSRITAVDFNAYVDVVQVAVEGADKLDVADVQKSLFEAGVLNLITPFTRYVTLLANGGRPIAEGAKVSAGPNG